MTGGQVEKWVSAGATIIAPATVLSALLFYFGYVSARSEYEYFGVDVDTIGLGTQDYIMRSPQPLLVPLLVLALLGAGLLTLHSAVRTRIAAALAGSGDGQRIRTAAYAVVAAGVAALCAGVLLLVGYAYLRDWPPYNLVTPLVIGVGAALIGYPVRVLRLLRGTGPSSVPARARDVLMFVLVAASVFWMTATVAQWSGRGLAQYQARDLDGLPVVILDTKDSLVLHDPYVEETVLPAGGAFHYRYRHLRLLIQGHDRMFLVPDHWSASDTTLVVALDDSVRLRFQFQNQPP
jgi:hypothetical protein